MSGSAKEKHRPAGVKAFHDLVSANADSNKRNHRTRPPKEPRKADTVITPAPLLDCMPLGALSTSKRHDNSASQRQRRNKRPDRDQLERNNDDDTGKSELAVSKTESGRSTIDIAEPCDEHFKALTVTFADILSKRFASDERLEQQRSVFVKLHQLIKKNKTDAQVNLYGSVQFGCSLAKTGDMDVDVQFKQIPSHDALKELLDMINQSDLCKKARIDTEHKPSCIQLTVTEPNIDVKITSGYVRGIHLSRLIRIYTKCEPRVLPLLRLFRFLAKMCNTDKPDIGTLHPVVFHLMTIHFLQQLEQPVLPCLHEYVYGIDHVPLTLNDNQYPEFFRACEEYASKWKSMNKTSVEMLFLQLLSYYVKTFNTKQFVVSIQTRMPVMKTDKNWHSRKLLVEDPTDIKRSLCQTMQAVRSSDYFRDTLNAALNYFGRKQKKPVKSQQTDPDDDPIEIVDDALAKEPAKSLHNSYKLFYKCLPPPVARDANIRQNRVREYYRQWFHSKHKQVPQPVVQLRTSKTTADELDDAEFREALQHDLEQNFETTDANDDDRNENHFHLLEGADSHPEDDEEQEVTEHFDEMNLEDEHQTAGQEPPVAAEDNDQQISNNEASATVTDDGQPSATADAPTTVAKETTETAQTIPTADEPAEVFVASMLQVTPTMPVDIERKTPKANGSVLGLSPFTTSCQLELSTVTKPTDVSDEFFYEFLAENFHAEQGAPYVCTTCNNVGHLKSECPELILPSMIELPNINEKWIDILSSLTQHITARSKPSPMNIEDRRSLLSQLEKQFKIDYPDCNVHAFGSFYNGFGFAHSDLDVCLVFQGKRKDENEVLRILQKIQRGLRASNVFDNIQPVLHAKVPIIRSRHRQLHIPIDISLHNMLAIENTRLLKTYTEIDPRVSELGYMIKHLAKFCDIGDASRGTLSSYAYIIMLIHFLQQTRPAVLPVLQKLSDDPSKPAAMYKKCDQWNVYFYEDLTKLRTLWSSDNKLSTGALWIEFLRYYTEQFNYEEHVVTIRQFEPLFKHEKGWFRQTIAIEDPFELSHNLAGGLSPRNMMGDPSGQQVTDTSSQQLLTPAERQALIQKLSPKWTYELITRVDNMIFEKSRGVKTVYVRMLQSYLSQIHRAYQPGTNPQQAPNNRLNTPFASQQSTSSQPPAMPTHLQTAPNSMNNSPLRFASPLTHQASPLAPRMNTPPVARLRDPLSFNSTTPNTIQYQAAPSTDPVQTYASQPPPAMPTVNRTDQLMHSTMPVNRYSNAPAMLQRPRLPTNLSGTFPPQPLASSANDVSRQLVGDKSMANVISAPVSMPANTALGADRFLHKILTAKSDGLSTAMSLTHRQSTLSTMPQSSTRFATTLPNSSVSSNVAAVRPLMKPQTTPPSPVVMPVQVSPGMSVQRSPLSTASSGSFSVNPQPPTNSSTPTMSNFTSPVGRSVSLAATGSILSPDEEMINLIKYLKDNLSRVQALHQRFTSEGNQDKAQNVQSLYQQMVQFTNNPTHETVTNAKRIRDLLERASVRPQPTAIVASQPAPILASQPAPILASLPAPPNAIAPQMSDMKQFKQAVTDYLSHDNKRRLFISRLFVEPLNDVINNVPHKKMRLDCDANTSYQFSTPPGRPNSCSLMSELDDELSLLPANLFSVERIPVSHAMKHAELDDEFLSKKGLVLRCKLLEEVNPLIPPLRLRVSPRYPHEQPEVLSLTDTMPPKLEFTDGHPFFEQISTSFVSRLFRLPPQHTVTDILNIWRQSVQTAL